MGIDIELSTTVSFVTIEAKHMSLYYPGYGKHCMVIVTKTTGKGINNLTIEPNKPLEALCWTDKHVGWNENSFTSEQLQDIKELLLNEFK